MATRIIPARLHRRAAALLAVLVLAACAPIQTTPSAGGGSSWGAPGAGGGAGGAIVDLPPGDLRAVAVNFAIAQDGKPYTQWPNNPALSCGRGSATCTRSGPDCFDCSGLTQTAYKHAGITLGPTTYYQINDGVSVSCTVADLNGAATTCWQPGDLVLFLDGSGPYHVAMYTGAGMFIEALNCGDGVMHWARPAGSFPRISVRRIVDTDGRTLLGGA